MFAVTNHFLANHCATIMVCGEIETSGSFRKLFTIAYATSKGTRRWGMCMNEQKKRC